MTNRILAAVSAITILTANGAAAQTASPVPADAPAAVEATAGPLNAASPRARADRIVFGSGNATTAHRTERLGQPIAPRIGVGPSTTEAAQDASTAHDTGRRLGRPLASRAGVSSSAAESVQDATTVHPRG